MFGRNEVAKKVNVHEPFRVHSIFRTLQGEGPFVGTPAIFVRFAGCNLRCYWCDTDFESKAIEYDPDDLFDAIKKMAGDNTPLVVFTGGEPLLQPLALLLTLRDEARNFHFQIETAGTVWPDGGLPWLDNLSFVVSPKTPKIVKELCNSDRYDVYWKYIVRCDEPVDEIDGLPLSSTQTKGAAQSLFRPSDLEGAAGRIFVQACDVQDGIKNISNRHYALAIALNHGYRLSIQTHKFLGLD